MSSYVYFRPGSGVYGENRLANEMRNISYQNETNQLHSHILKDLTRRTDYNKAVLRHSLCQVDPCYQYGTEQWHFGQDRENQRRTVFELLEAEKEAKSLFCDKNSYDARGYAGKEEEKQIDFCYLCSTLEEHQRHLARRGLRLKPKTPKKPRVKYIVPPPGIKPKKPEPKEEKQEVLYKVMVKTGHEVNSGTGANVFVRLIGNKGRMRKRQLKKKFASLGFHFGVGTTETFFIKGPDLGQMRWLRVEHDGADIKDSWLLDEIEITNMNTEEIAVFVCNSWLSLCMEDYSAKIDLKAEEKEELVEEYDITVVTGKKMLAGTDARVYITLYGNAGATLKKELKSKHKNPFERGSEDKFTITHKPIGRISKIKIEHDNSGRGPGWLLDYIAIRVFSTGHVYRFPCFQWIAVDEGDKTTFRYLQADNQRSSKMKSRASREENTSQVIYEVSVRTGACRGAGTDAKVYINMFGSGDRATGDIELDDEKDNFERGQIDTFKVKAVNVGRLKKVNIRHDNTSLAAGWFLEQITIKKYYSKAEIAELMSKADEDLEEKVAEKVAEETGVPHHKKTDKMKHKTSKRHKKRDEISETESESDSEDDEYERKGRYKKSKGRGSTDDKNRGRRNSRKFDSSSETEGDSDEDVVSRKRQSKKYGYNRKGERSHRSRHRDSESDESTSSETDSEDNKNSRKKSSKRKSQRHRHGRRGDNSEDSDVSDDETKKMLHEGLKDGKIPYYEEYEFPCKRWLATDEDDGKISRELKAKKVTLIYKS